MRGVSRNDGDKGVTHWTESDGRGSQSDQAPIASMGLMDSIGEVVDKLVENGCHPRVILGGGQLADNAFEPISTHR